MEFFISWGSVQERWMEFKECLPGKSNLFHSFGTKKDLELLWVLVPAPPPSGSATSFCNSLSSSWTTAYFHSETPYSKTIYNSLLASLFPC